MNKIVGQESVFRNIPGTGGRYSITIDGRVYLHPRNGRKGRFLKPWDKDPYLKVHLALGDDYPMAYIHRLVAMTFIPNSEGKKEVNHLNFDKHNNSIENLEWVTRKENVEHARAGGRYKRKAKATNAPVVVACITKIHKTLTEEDGGMQIAA